MKAIKNFNNKTNSVTLRLQASAIARTGITFSWTNKAGICFLLAHHGPLCRFSADANWPLRMTGLHWKECQMYRRVAHPKAEIQRQSRPQVIPIHAILQEIFINALYFWKDDFFIIHILIPVAFCKSKDFAQTTANWHHRSLHIAMH